MLNDMSAHWLWLIGGVALCGLEMFAPGVFLLWFGLAALATGLILFAAPLGFAWTLLVFAALSVAALALGRKVYGAAERNGTQAQLNNRAEALIGHVLTLETEMVDGEGRVRVLDASWRACGPDLPAGARVRVIGVAGGTVLEVEPAEPLAKS